MAKALSNAFILIKATRPHHILIILFVQALMLIGLRLEPKVDELIWFAIATIFTVAASHIINDVKDLESDSINYPDEVWVGKKVTKETARYFYWSLFFLALLSALQVSVEAYFLFTIVNLGLFIYAQWLIRLPIVGNVLVSGALTYAVLIIPEVFDAAVEDYPWAVVVSIFYLNLCLELLKDIRQVRGDTADGRRTLAVLLGVTHVSFILWLLLMLPAILSVTLFVALFVAFFDMSLFSDWNFYVIGGVMLFGLVAPTVFTAIAAYRVYLGRYKLKRLDRQIKILMLVGVVFWLLYVFSTYASGSSPYSTSF